MTFAERLHEIRTGFERPFWVANISELFERLSYYAAFASLARYLHESLNFDVKQASSLTGLFGGLVWFLAAFGGTLADRLGFRRSLSLAYLILSCSYFLLGSLGAPWLAPVRNAMPLIVLVTFVLMLPALGIALVKPAVVGTTARASKENVRSVGYSIYYTLVNVGSAAGPYLAHWVHQHVSVENVFRMAALSVFAMFFVVVLLFKEPRQAGEARTAIALTMVISFLTKRLHAFHAITLGTLITSLAWIILIVRPTVRMAVVTLVVVAIGEIMQQPRYYEYISRLAPSGQQGTYMGFAFLPIGIGSLIGGWFGGVLIHHFGEVTHQPSRIWCAVTGVGVATAALFLVFN